jgi:hypothetical protein
MAAHGFNAISQGGNHQVGAFFELGNAVLTNTESLGHALLSKLAGAAKFLECHLLSNKLGSARFHLLALRGSQFIDDVVHIPRHGLFPFLFQSGNMRVEPIIGLANKLTVKSLAATA